MQKMNQNDLSRWIGEQIRKARTSKKLSQEALAEAAQVSRVFISRLENGNQSAKIETYYRIACALDISLCTLFKANDDYDPLNEVIFLLSGCSSDEVCAYAEILRLVKSKFQLRNH